MNKDKNIFNVKILMFLILTLLFLYIGLLIYVYGLNHLSNSDIDYLKDSFENSIPNINNCNFDYYSISQHMSNWGFEHLRYRKIVSTTPSCFGKILYSGKVPGTQFVDIDLDSFIEYGVNQKLGFVLWLFEKDFLIFLIFFVFLIFLQIVFEKKILFKYFLILIILFSIFKFEDHNMFINSNKSYFPNEETKNLNLMNKWFKDAS